MQDQTAEHEIRKCATHARQLCHLSPKRFVEGKEAGRRMGARNVPLVADGLEFILVLRVGLDAQAGGQDELADGGAEAGEEGVEGLVGEEGVWLAFAFELGFD